MIEMACTKQPGDNRSSAQRTMKYVELAQSIPSLNEAWGPRLRRRATTSTRRSSAASCCATSTLLSVEALSMMRTRRSSNSLGQDAGDAFAQKAAVLIAGDHDVDAAQLTNPFFLKHRTRARGREDFTDPVA